MGLLATVSVPRAVPGFFSYGVPADLVPHIGVGKRVVVQFGKRGVLTAIVWKLESDAGTNAGLKQVLDVVDEHRPILNAIQLKLHGWIANYYLCYPGEVTAAGLPSGLKISSESRLQLNPGWELDSWENYSRQELDLLDVLGRQESISYEEAAAILGVKSPYQQIKRLQNQMAILVYDQANERYTPKKEKRVRLAMELLSTDAGLEQASQLLQHAPRQYELLMEYLREIPVWDDPEANERGIAVHQLVKGKRDMAGAVKGLIQKQIFQPFEQIVPRFSFPKVDRPYNPILSPLQQAAKDQILTGFGAGKPVLLHGITGSGKTEVYISLMLDAVAAGRQVLFLLPEIALTTQMVQRLHLAFGSQLGVYHSRFSDNERVELWQNLQQGRISVVLGVRSAVFLPFHDLGLVIIDEEHDPSYKQDRNNPRYNGRDTAIVLATLHQANVVMGSATPAIDSYYKAVSGKWHLSQLLERFGTATLPTIHLVDMRIETANKTLTGPISSVLLQATDEAIARGEQALMFQNRRGYAPQVICQQCASAPGCPNCDVTLTYHMLRNHLRCHYCGHHEAVPKTCGHCGATHLLTAGYGTEQLEEILVAARPQWRIRRMDQDTTRSKNSFTRLVEELEHNQVDVLVGTQMVSKGFDFKKMTVVGIFDIDRHMHLPHYRAREQTYQTLSQVAGRAGRHQENGHVYIQTVNPMLPLLQTIVNNDYQHLFQTEIQERQKFHFPPFCYLIELVLQHADAQKVRSSAHQLAHIIVQQLGSERVFGPAEPSVGKVRNMYLQHILIKIERVGVSLAEAKQRILNAVETLKQDAPNKAVYILINVDP